MKVSVIYNYEDIRNSIYIESVKDFRKDIKNCIVECLKEEDILVNEIQVYLKFTSNEDIKKINNEFRQVDNATDVLSFPMYDRVDLDKQIKEDRFNQIPLILGDIVISIEKVQQQSKEYGHTFKRELIYLVTHSMFHLLGYDHMVDKDKKIMREKEEVVLERLEISRHMEV